MCYNLIDQGAALERRVTKFLTRIVASLIMERIYIGLGDLSFRWLQQSEPYF